MLVLPNSIWKDPDAQVPQAPKQEKHQKIGRTAKSRSVARAGVERAPWH
jgi:hypothetical protein